jgi:tRNA threonylcarbamoyl adenosine modification protein YeaZ
VWQGEPTRAPEWLEDVGRLLAGQNVSTDSLGGYVCGLGPGSFSGIRACLAALSGLALPEGRPVFGLASAAALALGQSEVADQVTVVGDARRNRLWSVTYRVNADARRVQLFDGRTPSHTAADFHLVPAEKLADFVPSGTRVVSSDWDRLENVLRNTFAQNRLVQRCVYPKAADLGALAVADVHARVLEPLPIYLHPAVAVPESPPERHESCRHSDNGTLCP